MVCRLVAHNSNRKKKKVWVWVWGLKIRGENACFVLAKDLFVFLPGTEKKFCSVHAS